jgi:hypothetical protein
VLSRRAAAQNAGSGRELRAAPAKGTKPTRRRVHALSESVAFCRPTAARDGDGHFVGVCSRGPEVVAATPTDSDGARNDGGRPGEVRADGGSAQEDGMRVYGLVDYSE